MAFKYIYIYKISEHFFCLFVVVVVVVVVVLLLCFWERVVLGDQGIEEHCHYYQISKKIQWQYNAIQRNAMQRIVMQHNKINT